MTIVIDSSALETDNRTSVRPGALYGLVRLSNMGYRPLCTSDGLTDEQKHLLEREEILVDAETDDVAAQERLLTLTFDSRLNRLIIRDSEQDIASAAGWSELVEQFLFPTRETRLNRSTSETDISLRLNLDGSGKSNIQTGLRFFDHMLDQIAKHGLIDLDISCKGDLDVDEHHTIEDVAIVLGEALYELCGRDKTGIQRYGFLLPMDEAQARVAIDLSNRPYLVWDVRFQREYVGDFPLEMAEHFFHSLAMNLRATLQIAVEGSNEHHKIEAIFKGFAKSLRFAVSRSERNAGLLPSSKGKL